MKKATLILLISLYSFATMGFSLKQFYCCGQLKSTTISLAPGSEQKCSKGSEKGGCCENRYQTFQVKDNHVTADALTLPSKYFLDLDIFTPSFHDIAFTSKKATTAYQSNAPPLHSGVPIYIYNSVFRI